MGPSESRHPAKEAEFVSKQARELARDVLDVLMADDIGSMELLPQVLRGVAAHSDDAVPALAEAFEAEDPHRRVIAATLVLAAAAASPGKVVPRFKASAERIVVEALNGDDFPLQARACVFLMNARAPAAALPTLQRLREKANPVLATAAAAVLLATDLQDIQALKALTKALGSKVDSAACVAACALLQGRVGLERAIPKIGQILPRLGANEQYKILVTLKHSEDDASPFFAVARDILKDDKANPMVRWQAAALLGRMAQRKPVIPPLLRAVRCSDPRVAAGAVEGLQRSGDSSAETVSALAGLLSHENEHVRNHAATALKSLGVKAVSAIPAMIGRLEAEQDVDTCDLLIQALGATGDAAVPELKRFLQQPVTFRHEVFVKALALTGERGVRELVALVIDGDDRLGASIALVLGTLGKRSTAAVPALAERLDEADDNLAFYIVWFLYMCGPWAAPAIPALVRCICARDPREDEVGAWAERVLFGMRERAIPALEAARVNAPDSVRQRIEHTLKAFVGWKQETVTPLDGIDVRYLRQFEAVGNVLSKGPKSWAKILDLILDEHPEWKGVRGISARMLQLNVERVGTYLGGVRLTSHNKKSRQSGALTDGGIRWLAAIERYLKDRQQ
jgi:hypothetical protein